MLSLSKADFEASRNELYLVPAAALDALATNLELSVPIKFVHLSDDAQIVRVKCSKSGTQCRHALPPLCQRCTVPEHCSKSVLGSWSEMPFDPSRIVVEAVPWDPRVI
jgi:hypothetical protein